MNIKKRLTETFTSLGNSKASVNSEPSVEDVPNIEDMSVLRAEFWERYSLAEMNMAEWEALCDGCGGCCLEKFLDDPSEPTSVEYTEVSCRLLDCNTGYCSNYTNRHKYVPDCISLTIDNIANMMWLPSNCAYKRLYLGQGLPDWHLLITKNLEMTKRGMLQADVGVADRCISELHVDEEDLLEHIVHWVHA